MSMIAFIDKNTFEVKEELDSTLNELEKWVKELPTIK